MSSYNSVDYIRHYAHVLRGADPKVYEQFLQAFEMYATEITVAVTDAPQEQILNMQGRAKQTLVIFEQLRHPKLITKNPTPTAAP